MFRSLTQLGAPLIISAVVHVLFGLGALYSTIEVGTPPPAFTGDEYEAGITEDVDISGGFSFEEEAPLEESLDDLSNLEDLTFSDITPTDVEFEDPSDTPGGGDFGLGSGEGGGILGLGGGAGEAGSGGFGSGFGQRMRVGMAGVWNLNVQADHVAYVVDFSGSIITVVDDLKRELKRSIGRLRKSQTFNVILFFGEGNRTTSESFRPELVRASGENKRALIEWIDRMSPRGGTEPLMAVRRALDQRPQAIFFFSDGRFHPDVVDQITRANERVNAQIVCLLFDEMVFEDASGLPPGVDEQARLLQRLAEQNKGRSEQAAFMIVTLQDLYGS